MDGRAALLGVAALAGCGCGADAPVDAGPDAARWDAGWAPVDAGIRASLETYGAGPCDDWSVVMDARPRALPSDPTPRQLWRWDAAADPIYVASGITNEVVGTASIGPDGHLYLVGPEAWRLMSMGRDGRLRWIGTARPAGSFLTTPAIAPDGTLYSLQYPEESGAPMTLVVTRPDGTEAGSRVVPGDYPGTVRPQLAIGPRGRVYLTTSRGLLATCRGTVDEWLLEIVPPERALVSPRRVSVARSGDVALDAEGMSTVVVSDAGELLEIVRGAADATTQSTTIAALRDGRRTLVSVYRPLPEQWSAVILDRGLVTWSAAALSNPTSYRLDAADGVWSDEQMADGSHVFRRWLDAREEWQRTSTLLSGSAIAAGEDGSLLGRSERGELRRVRSDGEVAWEVAPEGPDGALGITNVALTLDRDGVLYAVAGSHVVAIQTDVLPPEQGRCLVRACNSRHNDWAASP